MKPLKQFIKEACNNCWYGIDGIYVINHGEWADPEIEFEGEFYNYWDVEEYVAQDLDIYDLYQKDGDEFNKYMAEHPEEVKQSMINYVADMVENA